MLVQKSQNIWTSTTLLLKLLQHISEWLTYFVSLLRQQNRLPPVSWEMQNFAQTSTVISSNWNLDTFDWHCGCIKRWQETLPLPCYILPRLLHVEQNMETLHWGGCEHWVDNYMYQTFLLVSPVCSICSSFLPQFKHIQFRWTEDSKLPEDVIGR